MLEQQPQRRLGRGLSALLGGGAAPAHTEAVTKESSDLRQIPVAAITRNPFQPRKDFDAEAINELASSIREHGVLQPLLVRETDGGFQLVAGERRWQAAQKAGLAKVPCRVVDVIDKTACEYALEENLKRKDLTDLEKAFAFKDYIAHFECTIEELGRQLSMSRSAVSNILRLLELPEPIKNALQSGKISSGHARALLTLDEADQLALCGRIQSEGMSVRQTEQAVRTLQKAKAEPAPAAAADTPDNNQAEGQPVANPETIPIGDADSHRTHHISSLEEQLRNLLGVNVSIKLSGKDKGMIEIPFSSNEEFERVLKTIRRAAAA